MARKKTSPKTCAAPAATGNVTLTLDGDLTIRDVAARREEWRTRVADATSITVDAAAVQRIDTAGLQLLVALRESARRRSVACEVSRPSQPLLDAVGTLGLGTALGVEAQIGK